MHPARVLTIILIFGTTVPCRSQSEPSDGTSYYGSYFKSYLLDTRDLFTAPTSWKGKEWLWMGTLSAGTVLIASQDGLIRDRIQSLRSPSGDNISRYLLEPWGNWYSIGTLGILYLAGDRNQHHHREAALNGIKAYLISGLVARIPKILFGRHRPYQNDPADPYLFDPFSFRFNSFVSGHTATNFAVATVITRSYPDSRWVGWVSYSVATVASMSRIYDDKHWASDVFAGAVLGYAVGTVIMNRGNWKVQIHATPTGITLTGKL